MKSKFRFSWLKGSLIWSILIQIAGAIPALPQSGLTPTGNGAIFFHPDGTYNTIMEEAVLAGVGTALVQSGSLIEPGTAAFVAEAPSRRDYEEIALEVVESGVEIVLGAGEEWLLPMGVRGRFGMGKRTDGRNLVEELRQKGYTVVYTLQTLVPHLSPNPPLKFRSTLGTFPIALCFGQFVWNILKPCHILSLLHKKNLIQASSRFHWGLPNLD